MYVLELRGPNIRRIAAKRKVNAVLQRCFGITLCDCDVASMQL